MLVICIAILLYSYTTGFPRLLESPGKIVATRHHILSYNAPNSILNPVLGELTTLPQIP